MTQMSHFASKRDSHHLSSTSNLTDTHLDDLVVHVVGEAGSPEVPLIAVDANRAVDAEEGHPNPHHTLRHAPDDIKGLLVTPPRG